MPEFKKRVMSDIVPPQKKVALSLLPPPPRKNIDLPPPNQVRLPSPILPQKSQRLKFPKFKFVRIKMILCVILIFTAYAAVSIVFAEMKVTIVPKTFSVSLDETLELSYNLSPGKLSFSEISLKDERNGSFSSSEKKFFESKARGKITIFNKNSDSQVLVAGTRFESSSGKIYKIEKGVVVPENGSLDTEVVAQKTGAEYNEEDIVDFKIPGFKEQRSPKFNTVYAKSKDKITGGFSGSSLVVGEKDIKNAKLSLLNAAVLETSQNLKRKTPDDSFLLAQSVRYNIVEENSEPKTGQPGDKFILNVSGSVSGIVVNKKELEKGLGKKIPNYDSSREHYKIKNLENVSFELKGFRPGVSDFKIHVTGIAEFAGDIDGEIARKNIFEKKLKKSSSILEVFPAASLVKVRFRPFWLRSFPDKEERIVLRVN